MARPGRGGVTHARVLAAVYVMFWVAHSIGLMAARYNYVRLPLVLLALPLVFRPRGDMTLASGSGPEASGNVPLLQASFEASTVVALNLLAFAALSSVLELAVARP